MPIFNKYRLRCTTDNTDECVMGTTEPTLCPTNPAHTIDTSSIAIVATGISVSNGCAKELSLADLKHMRISEIDQRTEELIAAGFTYASKQFSLSLPAQLKMTGTHQIKDDVALTYPINWNSIDDTDVYAIANAADLDVFFLTGVGTLRAHLDSGTALKDSARAAANVAAVDAVVDTR